MYVVFPVGMKHVVVRLASFRAILSRLLERLIAEADATDWMRPRCCRIGRPANRL